ncbi:hypothetical protein M378DRAFT_524599 [Amanita muscaria Koide BX008]|uniref:Uncharacterized protein n=1 Tax=Amanita muscaria (strain Koide BX008) TaxID=946122 RepID=A0A0C2WJN2_AMAMK|nr:hypothetical protein M378DRAFT_524599 [Amanita muscaria Koide BX008]
MIACDGRPQTLRPFHQSHYKTCPNWELLQEITIGRSSAPLRRNDINLEPTSWMNFWESWLVSSETFMSDFSVTIQKPSLLRTENDLHGHRALVLLKYAHRASPTLDTCRIPTCPQR